MGRSALLLGHIHNRIVFTHSLVGHRLLVATAGRHVNVYDLRNMSQPEQRRESSLNIKLDVCTVIPMGQVIF